MRPELGGEGAGVRWPRVPAGAGYIALILDEPSVPGGGGLLHLQNLDLPSPQILLHNENA